MVSIFDFYDMMEKGNVLLSFKGEVTSELLTSVLQIMEHKMDKMDESPKIRKKVYNILVECLQNLYHHIGEDPSAEEHDKTAFFMIGKENGIYSIMTGNYILEENVDKLRTKLDTINSMNKEELKEYYKQVLNNGEMSAKGGGGLGMIDIARKSGHKLDYNFKPINDNHSFFSLKVTVG